MTPFNELEEQIGINFKNKTLLENVFIHRSYLNEHKSYHLPSNEKLEFLGDSVLSLITSIYLYKNFPDLQEGDYTDIKAAIVRTESLAEVAAKLELGRYLFLSKGEEKGKGRTNTNILADSFEALVAAIFIDKSFDAAYEFVLKYLFKDKLEYIVENKLYLSPKSRLQELLQAEYKVLPIYKTTSELGPEHNKEFKVSVYLKSKLLGIGSGTSKKAGRGTSCEKCAGKNALKPL